MWSISNHYNKKKRERKRLWCIWSSDVLQRKSKEKILGVVSWVASTDGKQGASQRSQPSTVLGFDPVGERVNFRQRRTGLIIYVS